MLVEALSLARVIGAVHAIGIELARGGALDPDMPDVARPVVGRVEFDRLIGKSLEAPQREGGLRRSRPG